MKRNLKSYCRSIQKKFKSPIVGLHCHCVENKESLLALLEKAKNENVKYLSITNHKSLKIYTEILPSLTDEELEPYKKIKLIPSMEMPGNFEFTNLKGEKYNLEVHTLGYGVDLSKVKLLQNFVASNYKGLNQEEDLKRLIKIGHEVGLKFKDEDTYLDPKDENRQFAGRAFVQALMKKTGNEEIDNETMNANFCQKGETDKNKLPFLLRDDWRGFYNYCEKDSDSPFFLDISELHLNPDVENIVQLIQSMGGKAYLAHPSAYFSKNGNKDEIQTSKKNIIKFVIDFIKKNPSIDGVEVFHSVSLQGDMQILNALQGLLKTYRSLGTSGGTDIHQSNTPNDEKVSDTSFDTQIAKSMLKRSYYLIKSAQGITDLRNKCKEKQDEEQNEH